MMISLVDVEGRFRLTLGWMLMWMICRFLLPSCRFRFEFVLYGDDVVMSFVLYWLIRRLNGLGKRYEEMLERTTAAM